MNLHGRNNFVIILLGVVSFLMLSSTIHAQGVHLSTKQIGATAVYSAQIPPNPCVKFNLGEGKTRTVVGFNYSAYSVDNNGVMNGNLTFLDLSQSRVAQVTIAGRTISDFHLDPSYGNISNAEESKRQQVNYKLNSPIEFSTSDTASIRVENVKVLSGGPVKLVFGLEEPTGVYCLHSGWTTTTIGSSQADIAPTQSVRSWKPTLSIKPSLAAKVVTVTPSVTPVPPTPHNTPADKKLPSPLQNFIDFLKHIFQV